MLNRTETVNIALLFLGWTLCNVCLGVLLLANVIFLYLGFLCDRGAARDNISQDVGHNMLRIMNDSFFICTGAAGITYPQVFFCDNGAARDYITQDL